MRTDNAISSLPAPLLAARFLLPIAGGRSDDPNWRYAGRYLVLWGLLLGVVYAAVFRLSWKWFGEYQYIRFVPVAFVLATDLAFGGYRLLQGAAEVASRRSGRELALSGLLTVLLIAIGKYALLLSLPMGSHETAYWGPWRGRLGQLYPLAIYRPLILMPLWGRWAMMLATSIGRSAPGCSHRLEQMAGRTRLSLTMALWLACGIVTTIYSGGLHGHPERGLVIALGMMVAAYLASFALSRTHGGQTEATVGTVGTAAELTFLLLYLGIAGRIHWY